MRVQARPDQLLDGTTGKWEVVIGMEVHAQVTSKSKLFSGASTEFGGAPNSHVSLVDAAMPGMLPVINEECVKQAIRSGLGLSAQINLKSVFDRKNYFYPDLPQGYQISQYKQPIVGEGEVVIDIPDNKTTTIGIERLHLEQDAGKSLHDRHPTLSYVDLNRSGVALMEIVSKPDLRSFDDAMNFMVNVRRILRYLGTCDGDMEKGNLRADVNVSVCKPGGPFGTRCEIKNLNSINAIGQAIYYEANRQIGILEEGGTIEQETRLFDPVKIETRPMRTKEEAHDYRYFPDPDLLPLKIAPSLVEELKAQQPEMPDAKRGRFRQQYGLSIYEAGRLTDDRETADFFEAQIKAGADPKAAANWQINEILGRLNKTDPDKLRALSRPTGPTGPTWSVEVMGPTGPAANTAILQMVSSDAISGRAAKDVLDKLWTRALAEGPIDDPKAVKAIVEEEDLAQVTDLSLIEKLVDEVIAANPDKVAQAKSNPKAIGWFVGQVMKASGGKASPQAVNELLKRKLGA